MAFLAFLSVSGCTRCPYAMTCRVPASHVNFRKAGVSDPADQVLRGGQQVAPGTQAELGRTSCEMLPGGRGAG